MRFTYHPSVTDDDLDAEDLIDKDNGNITVASDVEEEYRPLLKAAPALLKACESVVRFWLNTPVDPNEYRAKMEKCSNLLVDAVAKAKGK